MAKKAATDLATTQPQGTTLVNPSDLAALMDREFGEDALTEGAGDVDPEDIQLASLTWNKKGTDPSGNPIAANLYFHTVDETLQRTVRAAFLYQRKENRWAFWDSADDRMRTVCTSHDRVTGTLRMDQPNIGKEGLQRPCAGCPEKRWHTKPDGKREQLCADEYRVIALDLDTQQPFAIRYKKAAGKVFRTHLQRHHLNKMMRGGRPSHVPLFAYEVELSLTMDVGGKYANPVIKRGEVLHEQLQELHVAARSAREYAERALDALGDSHDFDDGGAAASETPRGNGAQQTQFTDEDY